MDMDNSVVMGGIRELNGSGEKYNKNKQIKLTIWKKGSSKRQRISFRNALQMCLERRIELLFSIIRFYYKMQYLAFV